MILYAKSDPVQSIEEHTDNLLTVMEKIRKSLDSRVSIDWNLLKIIVITHDLGKINALFQQRIASAIQTEKVTPKQPDEIDHNLLSAAFLQEIFKQMSVESAKKHILYKAVMFHHHNFLYYMEHIDRFSPDKIQTAIYHHIEKAYDAADPRITRLAQYLKQTLDLPSVPNLQNLDYDFFFFYNEDFSDANHLQKREFLILKGLLHLCDHIASSGFQEAGEFYFGKNDIQNIDLWITRFLQQKTDISSIHFKDFQELTANNTNRDIITIAFTGSGKTVADHRWTGARKIYLVPTRISAEAFYLDSIDIYGEDKVGILHGDISLYVDVTDEDSISISEGTYQLSVNLSRPYILSTIDQIATAIFKYPNYEKTLAALLNTHITVDEIHLLTPKMYLLLLYLLSFLKDSQFNVHFHLMSATVPQLYIQKMHEIVGETYLMNRIEVDESNKANIKIDAQSFGTDGHEKRKIQQIRQWIGESRRALVIVNSIGHAAELYDDLTRLYDTQESRHIYLLHSRFKFDDKKVKYKQITDEKPPGIWITTQVVEVALDIDFPVVISELAPFESLIQRMGRCNRRARLETGHFFVFEDKAYERINGKIYNPIFFPETASVIQRAKKKIPILSQQKRKELLETYFESPKVKKEYEEEFTAAHSAIYKLFDIRFASQKKDLKISGTDLVFEIDPHINMTENRRQAQRLFREGELQQKIILNSDFEKILSAKPEKKQRELARMSIPISQGILWRLRTRYPDLLKQRKNLFILDDDNDVVQYTHEKGLEIIDHVSKTGSNII